MKRGRFTSFTVCFSDPMNKGFENIVEKGENAGDQHFLLFQQCFAGWLSDEHDGLMTWWLQVRSPVEATFLSCAFSPLTSAEACENSSRWLWEEKLC